jgi:hypothetical protein
LLSRYIDSFYAQFCLALLVVTPLVNVKGYFLTSGLSLYLLLAFSAERSIESGQRTLFGMLGLLVIGVGILLCVPGMSRAGIFYLSLGVLMLLLISVFQNAGPGNFLFKFFKPDFPDRQQRLWSLYKLSGWGRPLFGITLVVMVIISGLVLLKSYKVWTIRKDSLRDWTNDSFWTEVSLAKGMILSGSNIGLVQLRTRRPVLLDGHELGQLPYTMNSGAWIQTAHILLDIYGVDVLDPPPEIREKRPGALLHDTGKALWESRQPTDWLRIGQEYGVTHILTYLNWELRLPRVESNDRFILYKISNLAVPKKDAQ